MAKRVLQLASCLCAAALFACGENPPSRAETGPAPVRSATPGQDPAFEDPTAIEGRFDVGGHHLYISCRGSRAPTVVYLHGYGRGRASAGLVPDLIARRGQRVCVYDRANVGRSDLIAGPQTGEDSVRDLHALLRVAHVPGPYVLLGSSFGGLISVMYADAHPRQVAGMVLLDASLPGDLSIDERFLGADERLRQEDWAGTSERFDRWTTYRQARRIRGVSLQMPVTYLVARRREFPITYLGRRRLDLPATWPARAMATAIRRMQRDFVASLPRGRLVTVDAAHYMEPVIPERIAREVERVIEASRRKLA